ncbi:MAG: glycosyltransferase [Bacteroidales bacterium]|nr:glycosyltransferase [Bacteroidales bacterium]MBR6929721.1 glycosyltransferase [Bacteroidales bacterium]
MKIFFIARGWPSDREPQWGSFERDQALALQKLGHQVVMLSVDMRFRKYHRKYGITCETHEGIPHYNLFAGSIWGLALRRFSINLYTKVRRFLFVHLLKEVNKHEGMPDLFYGHYLVNASTALAAKKKYGIPVVGIEHWSELGYANIKKNVKKWAGKTYKDLDCLLTVSSALRENILKNFDVDSVVVNNMVGHEFCYAPTEREGKVVRFVTTGNLLPVKGFDNLVNAFSKLHLSPETWTLNIIGGGKERESLQQQIDSVGLSNNIHLLGRKNREGVIEMLHKSDVYVMSSRSETFGVAAIEALACGLPVIATDCGGARDFVTKENGKICAVDDIQKLSEAILYMYKNNGDYDRAQIAVDCQKRFSSEAIGKQLEGVFEKVIRINEKQ